MNIHRCARSWIGLIIMATQWSPSPCALSPAKQVKKQKGNMDIELTVDCLELSDHLDHYVIFSGDGDFISLVKALKRRGKRHHHCVHIKDEPTYFVR